ncbi:hypothetical protein EJ110_NYTH11959 [Nymphaea thermarum]|nr:hypothetical protein EJ110_NYTH11959 [Nymphaea thermarum]
MATTNPFDLLGGDDSGDLTQLIASAQQQQVVKAEPTKKTAQPPAAKLPSKPLPPAQSVRESRNEASGGRGGGRSGGRGYARGRGGFNRDTNNNGNGYGNGYSGGYGGQDDGEVEKQSERSRGGFGGPRGSFRGGRRGGFANGDSGEGGRPRRQFDRHSGTGRGNEFKREGTGRGNWGAPTDEGFVQEGEELVNDNEKKFTPEKQPDGEELAGEDRQTTLEEPEEKEHEDKEMTLEEYQKVLEEKRKILLGLKHEERKVDLDKELQSMQQLSLKKDNDDVFIQLRSDRDLARRKEINEKDEKVKKSFPINEFLKLAEGERYYGPRGRGRGRGRGDRGGFRSGFAPGEVNSMAAPAIQDPGQFPTLGGK